jgi:hypothetical protein
VEKREPELVDLEVVRVNLAKSVNRLKVPAVKLVRAQKSLNLPVILEPTVLGKVVIDRIRLMHHLVRMHLPITGQRGLWIRPSRP